MGCLDVLLLFAFVAAAEQQDLLVALRSAIDPVTRSVIDAELKNTLADSLPVSAQTGAQSINACQDSTASRLVAEIFDPLAKRASCFARFDTPECPPL
jgi:hypothetical protein